MLACGLNCSTGFMAGCMGLTLGPPHIEGRRVTCERSVKLTPSWGIVACFDLAFAQPTFLSSRKAMAATCTKFWSFVWGIDCWSGAEVWANQSKGFWGGVRGKFFFDPPYLPSQGSWGAENFFSKESLRGTCAGKISAPLTEGWTMEWMLSDFPNFGGRIRLTIYLRKYGVDQSLFFTWFSRNSPHFP